MTGTRFHQWFVVSLFLVLLGLLVSTQAPHVHAANITVNDLNDSLTLGSCSTNGTGTCTLREAIYYANTNLGPDTINFSTSGTITLIFTLIKSTDTLTIDATGQSIVIDGDNTHLTMQADTAAPLTLKNLTLTKSYNPGSGGAIAADDALTLDTVTVQNSKADGFGGGVYAKGAASFIDSLITGNQAVKGGGAFFDGTANLNGTTFAQNTTTDAVNEPSGGGAFFNNTATLTNVYFDKNTAGGAANTSGAGGAAFVFGATVTGGAFTANIGNFAGGGAYFGSNVTVNSTIFFNNKTNTNRGGGAYFEGPAVVQNALFNGNSTADIGGGAYFKNTADVNATSFITNTAVDRAGGAYFFNTAALTDTNFYTNTGTVLGGGAYFSVPSSILNGVIQGNTCTSTCSGGGAYLNASSGISGTQVLTNTADSHGGGLALSNGASIFQAVVQGNESTGGHGGGVASETGTLIISSTLVLDNKADAVNSVGGGIASSGLTGIVNSTLRGNSGYGGGGAANGGSMMVVFSTFDSNTAVAGGGILNANEAFVVGSTFDKNSATNGGGIAADTAAATELYNVTLANSTSGGGVYLDLGGGNAKQFSTLHLSGATATVSRSDLEKLGLNHLPERPSAPTSLSLFNTILADNTGGDCINNGLFVDATNSLIKDGLTCVTGTNTNNLTGDPALIPLADNGGPTETMALQTYSPAIDAADPDACAMFGIITDQRGEPRDDLQCDMGAFELKFTDSPSVTRNDLPVGTTQTYGPTLARTKLLSGTLLDLTILLTNGAPANTPPPSNALPRQWDLTNVCYLCNKADAPQKPTAFSLDVSFCYAPSILSGQDETKLHVWHYNGSTWDDLGGTLDDTTYTNYHCIGATTPVTTLSPFIVAPAGPTSTDVTGVRGAVNTHNNVVLRWKTVTEERIAGFNIYRQTKSGAWKQLNANQRVAKHAGTALSDKYRFTDRSVKAGRTYRYKLQVVYLDNHTEWSSIIKVKTP